MMEGTEFSHDMVGKYNLFSCCTLLLTQLGTQERAPRERSEDLRLNRAQWFLIGRMGLVHPDMER